MFFSLFKVFFKCRINLLLQFPRLLKFKPNSSPYTKDSPNNLLYETQKTAFRSGISEKFYKFFVSQTEITFRDWSIPTYCNVGI